MLRCTIALFLALASVDAQSFKLSKIDATGVKRFSVADIAKISGLAVGQAMTQADLDAVVTRMGASGLFKQVSYRFATENGQIVVTFAVEEEAWDTPVLYDNFIGIPDEELSRAIRAEVPTYDGTAPGNGMVPLVSHALTGVLQSHGIPGTIEYHALANLDGSNRRNVFRIAPAPPLCSLHVDGAANVPEAEVVAVVKSAIGADYSRHQLEGLARTSLASPYRERGYWKASFTNPTATLGAVGACRGVLATVHVDEGSPYTWDHAEWTGSSALTAKELDALLAFKSGEVADSAKLSRGLFAIQAAQHKRGYLMADSTSNPVLDDAAHTAVFKVAIAEGPQFHMGTVTFVGVPPDEANALASKWKLKPGDPFDQSYAGDFRLKELRAYPAPHAFEPSFTADPATHVVSVVFTRK